MYDDLLLPPGAEGLKGVLEILKEQSLKIRSFPQAVFFEKTVLKIFGKSLENYPRQNAYWQPITMLNSALSLLFF